MSDPKQSRWYFLPLRGWCNIPDTWQHPHLSHTNPLVPKNTGFLLLTRPSVEAHVLYMCRSDGTCCVVVIWTVTVPSRFINNSITDECCLHFMLQCDVLNTLSLMFGNRITSPYQISACQCYPSLWWWRFIQSTDTGTQENTCVNFVSLHTFLIY